jgi:drug/metabolite transporter (DMT)-like permease
MEAHDLGYLATTTETAPAPVPGRPVLLAAGAMTLLGASAGVSAHLTAYPVLGGQAIRYAVAAAILLALVAARCAALEPRLRAGELVRLVALSATGLVGFNICVLEALRHADPATVGSIIGITPLVLALADPLLARRRPRAQLVTGASVVVAGAALIQGFGSADLTGLCYALGALAGEAAFSLLAVPLLPRLGPLRVSAYVSALAVPLLVLGGLVVDGAGMLRVPTRVEVAALLYLAVILTVIAFLLWYAALPVLGAERAGLFAGLVPVAAAASQVLLGLGGPTVGEVVGALLVGGGATVGLAPGRSRETP